MDTKWTSKLKRIFIGGIIRQIIVVAILSVIGVIFLTRLVVGDRKYLKFKSELTLNYLLETSDKLSEEISQYNIHENIINNKAVSQNDFEKHVFKGSKVKYNFISFVLIDKNTKKIYSNTRDYCFEKGDLKNDLGKAKDIEAYIKKYALVFYKVDYTNTFPPFSETFIKKDPRKIQPYGGRFQRFVEYYWLDKRNTDNQVIIYDLCSNMYRAWRELIYVILWFFTLIFFIAYLRKKGLEEIKSNAKNEILLMKLNFKHSVLSIKMAGKLLIKMINTTLEKLTISNMKLRCILILIITITLPSILSEVIYSRRLSVLRILHAFKFFIADVPIRYILEDFFIVYLVIIFLYIMKKVNYFEYILKSADKIADGDFSIELNESGDKDLSKLAHNINLIKHDYQNAIEERIKDERLKSEIVLNVSNNLKLPVNSIESYISLYKNENTLAKEKEEYLNIIYDKAKKLKTLIENLFEVSKLNSGKVEINKEDIDIMELIYQVIGESLDNYSEKNIKFIVNSFSEEVIINADGKKISRLIEELISNTLEHSLAGTRVYIDVEKADDKMMLSIKNVANYDMELDEKFSPKASKFGIIIASGIAEIHGGSMKIEREGDLFKVYLLLSLKK